MKLAAVLLLIGSWSFLFLHTSAAPYLNNQWRPHRWATQQTTAKAIADYEACRSKIASTNETTEATLAAFLCVDPRQSSFITFRTADGEEAKFDICLEHGELRRIK